MLIKGLCAASGLLQQPVSAWRSMRHQHRMLRESSKRRYPPKWKEDRVLLGEDSWKRTAPKRCACRRHDETVIRRVKMRKLEGFHGGGITISSLQDRWTGRRRTTCSTHVTSLKKKRGPLLTETDWSEIVRGRCIRQKSIEDVDEMTQW